VHSLLLLIARDALIGFDSRDDSERLVDGPLAPSRVPVGFIERQDLEQAERVALLRIECDPAPELVDPDGFDPALSAVPDLLQLNPCVGMLTELPDGSLDNPCTGFSGLVRSPMNFTTCASCATQPPRQARQTPGRPMLPGVASIT
jgi:hypothetical protein